jgi:hypothetical protein
MHPSERLSPPTPPDDLDRLLSAYFRAETPDPWPPAPAAPPPAPARRPRRGSRLALAAAVALLLGGQLYLAGRFLDAPTSDPDNPGRLTGSRSRPKPSLSTAPGDRVQPADEDDLLPEGKP